MLKKIQKTVTLITVLSMIFMYGAFAPDANADYINTSSDEMSSADSGAVSNHTITFTTPTGVAADATITITFPAGFDLGNISYTDFDLTDTGGELELAATPSGATWGVATSGQVITLTNGSAVVAADSVIEIEIGTNATHADTGVNQITNNATANSYTISIGGTFGDTGDITVVILDNSAVDISASVSQSLTFTIDDNTIGFGALSASDDRFATTDANGSSSEASSTLITVGTNAASGYSVKVSGATLTDSGSSAEIAAIGASAASSTTGTEQFGIRVSASGGSGVVVTPYNGATSYAYDGVSTADEIASCASASADTKYSVYYVANIASQTEAGNYSTTLTYTATGNF